MFSIVFRIGATLLGVLLLAACIAQPRQHDRYDDRYADRYEDSYEDRTHDRYRDRYASRRCETCGTVERIEEVWVSQRAGGGGVVLGAIIGAAIGNQIGSGSGRDAATVAGAVAGGAIGHQVESGRRGERRGYRFEVRMDDGRWAEVTQLQHHGLRPGDAVVIRRDQVVPLD